MRNTPISEQAIAGAAMGAATAGLRPVAEIMFSDFYATCWDQVANEIAKARYMTGGQFRMPLVIRGCNGGGLGFGAQHSQSIENWAMCVPGLKIVFPVDRRRHVGAPGRVRSGTTSRCWCSSTRRCDERPWDAARCPTAITSSPWARPRSSHRR